MTSKNAPEHLVRRWVEDVLAGLVCTEDHLRVAILKQVSIARTNEEEDVLREITEAWVGVRDTKRLVSCAHPNNTSPQCQPHQGDVDASNLQTALQAIIAQGAGQ